MSLPRSTEVLVVGGGPAGASTAWHLAQAGCEVTLVDRARFPRAKPCAEYVSPEGARILEAMGALGTLEASGSAALTGMVVHAPSGERIHGEFVAAHGFRGFRDRGLGIRRERLDTELLARARAAGVRVLEGAKVDALLTSDRGGVDGVLVRDADGMREIRASVVIGADGLRSVVARRLAVAHTARWPRRLALVAHYRGVQGIGTLGEMHVTREGYIGLASVGDGVTNVALVVPTRLAGDARTGVAGDADGFLRRWLAAHPHIGERFAGAERVSPVRATGPFGSRARRPYGDGALLVGDAADFYDPFTGEGIYAALRGGELVAPYAAAMVAARQRADHRGVADAGRAYEAARAAAFGGKWRVEQLIGLAVTFPSLMDGAAHLLSRHRGLADLLVGVTGDFVPARALLSPRTLWRALRGAPLSSPAPVRHVHQR